MGSLKVKLFGKPYVHSVDHKLLALPAKVQELFFFLLLNRRYPHDRDYLAEQLWGEAEPVRSKKYLRQTLWQLQTAIDTPSASAFPLLILEKNWIHVNLEMIGWLDVQEVEQAFMAVCDVPSRQLSPEQIQAMQKAAELYQGELLTGWYQDWCILERERFQSIALALLEKLMEACICQQQYEYGVQCGMRVLHYDRARERTHRLLMRLHYLAGNRSAALRQFSQCTAALAEELNVKPAQRTLDLRDQIRADQLSPAPPPATHPLVAPAVLPLPAAQVVAELTQLQLHLSALQQEVKTLIQRLNVSP